MSRENVERHRRALAAVNARDLDALLALRDGDVQVESRLVPMEGGYHGHDGVRRWWADVFDGFPDFAIGPVAIGGLGDVTVARIRNHAHGADSRTPVVETLWQVVEWRDGKVAWWTACPTEAEALDAAGRRR